MTATQTASDAHASVPGKKRNGKVGSKHNWKGARANTESTITWEHEIGKISVTAKGYRLGASHEKKGYYFAQLNMHHHQPSFIDLEFTSNLAESIVALYSQDGNLVECGTKPIPKLSVPVQWLKEGESVDVKTGKRIPAPKGSRRVLRRDDEPALRPHTRVRGRDNADIILLLKDGTFIDLQVSLLTRGGMFWLSIQEIWAGQVVKVPDIEDYTAPFKTVQVGNDHFIVAPIWAEFAYPGADYLAVMPTMGPKLVAMAAEADRYLEVEDGFDLPEWNPPGVAPVSGWQNTGVVLFFNPLVGARVLDQENVEYFVPPGVIQNDEGKSTMKEGDYPVIYSGQMVAFNSNPKKDGQRNAIVTKLLALED